MRLSVASDDAHPNELRVPDRDVLAGIYIGRSQWKIISREESSSGGLGTEVVLRTARGLSSRTRCLLFSCRRAATGAMPYQLFEAVCRAQSDAHCGNRQGHARDRRYPIHCNLRDLAGAAYLPTLPNGLSHHCHNWKYRFTRSADLRAAICSLR